MTVANLRVDIALRRSVAAYTVFFLSDFYKPEIICTIMQTIDKRINNPNEISLFFICSIAFNFYGDMENTNAMGVNTTNMPCQKQPIKPLKTGCGLLYAGPRVQMVRLVSFWYHVIMVSQKQTPESRFAFRRPDIDYGACNNGQSKTNGGEGVNERRGDPDFENNFNKKMDV